MEKMAWDGPKWGQEDFFLLIQTLPISFAEWICILLIFIFLFFNSTFLHFQVPRSPNFQISRLPDFHILRFPDAGSSDGDDGQTLSFQLDLSPNAPRDQIHRKVLRSVAICFSCIGALWIKPKNVCDHAWVNVDPE